MKTRLYDVRVKGARLFRRMRAANPTAAALRFVGESEVSTADADVFVTIMVYDASNVVMHERIVECRRE